MALHSGIHPMAFNSEREKMGEENIQKKLIKCKTDQKSSEMRGSNHAMVSFNSSLFTIFVHAHMDIKIVIMSARSS
jgi:hypothetical protein